MLPRLFFFRYSCRLRTYSVIAASRVTRCLSSSSLAAASRSPCLINPWMNKHHLFFHKKLVRSRRAYGGAIELGRSWKMFESEDIGRGWKKFKSEIVGRCLTVNKWPFGSHCFSISVGGLTSFSFISKSSGRDGSCFLHSMVTSWSPHPFFCFRHSCWPRTHGMIAVCSRRWCHWTWRLHVLMASHHCIYCLLNAIFCGCVLVNALHSAAHWLVFSDCSRCLESAVVSSERTPAVMMLVWILLLTRTRLGPS